MRHLILYGKSIDMWTFKMAATKSNITDRFCQFSSKMKHFADSKIIWNKNLGVFKILESILHDPIDTKQHQILFVRSQFLDDKSEKR